MFDRKFDLGSLVEHWKCPGRPSKMNIVCVLCKNLDICFRDYLEECIEGKHENEKTRV